MRVMIVEDQTMIRSLLESYFRAEDGYRIVASIPGAKQAVEVCRASSVDLILMDVQTENRENGLTAVHRIKAIRPKTKIIVVTSLIDCAVLEEAKKAGADSLWYKDSTEKRLMNVVRQTMSGEHIFPDTPPTVEIGMAKSTEFTRTELKFCGICCGACPTRASRQRWAARCQRSNSMWQTCCKKPGWKTSSSLLWRSATSSWLPIWRKSDGI